MSAEAIKPTTSRKPKNFAVINGSCKMAHLTDGARPHACPKCGTVMKMRYECPFCHFKLKERPKETKPRKPRRKKC